MIYAAFQGHSPPLLQTCLLLLIALPIAVNAVFHPESPCPTVFNYEGNEPEFDRWYGDVQMVSNDNLVGIVLNIRFDRVTQLLVSWMGEVTTEDNYMYSIIDLNQRLEAKIPFHSRFMVKFNGTRGSPRIKTIRLNGRQICPPEINIQVMNGERRPIVLLTKNVVNELQQKPKVTTDKNHRVVTRRPDPVFPDNFPTTSYYQDFMTPSTPRHRVTTTEKYVEIEEVPYNPNSNLKPQTNKNKVSSGANSYGGYDNNYSTGNVNRPSSNQDSDSDRSPSYNRPKKPSQFNGEAETPYSSNVDRPSGPSGPKNPYNQGSSNNYNPSMSSSSGGTNARPLNKKPSNGDYDEDNGYPSSGQSSSNNKRKPTNTADHHYNEDSGYDSGGQPSVNKKPSTSSNNNYNEDSSYNSGGQPSKKPSTTSNHNYNEDSGYSSGSQPSSNKKPSTTSNHNYNEDNGYSQPSKKPSTSNHNYNEDNGYSSGSQPPKKPSTTSNNNYNEEDGYSNSGSQPNYNTEDKPRPTSINTSNKKPSGGDYYEEDNGYSNSNSQSGYNNKPKQPDSLNMNSGRPSGPSRPTNIEHINGNREENRKPSSTNNGYETGNNGYSNVASNSYNNGGSNNGYNGGGGSGGANNNGYDNGNYNSGGSNNGHNKGQGNNHGSGMSPSYEAPSGSNNGNYPGNIPGDIDKTDNINIGDVQPAKSEKTVIITSIHKNTYVVGASGNKEEEEFNGNGSGENGYNNNANSKPSVVMKPSSGQSSNKPNTGSGGKKPAHSSKPQQNSNKDEQCGVISPELATRVTPLVTNGQATARGQWPWHVALYKTDGINLTYICGGSLITSNIVVTAAHCVTKKPLDRPVDANTIVIYLGKYHLQQYSDDGGIQIKQVLEIVPFPTYNSSNYLGDIALLKMTSNAEYTNFVRPVCMWDHRVSELSSVIDKEGTVIGWGYDEHDKASEELKMAKMPVVSQETCIFSNRPFFSQFTSNKTFCAGFRNGTSVCNGDSGGGMVFSRGNSWHLRGIVSISVAQSGLRKCDTKHYVVFSDVAKYLDWINKYIEKNKENKGNY